jgi:hypothetical protein
MHEEGVNTMHPFPGLAGPAQLLGAVQGCSCHVYMQSLSLVPPRKTSVPYLPTYLGSVNRIYGCLGSSNDRQQQSCLEMGATVQLNSLVNNDLKPDQKSIQVRSPLSRAVCATHLTFSPCEPRCRDTPATDVTRPRRIGSQASAMFAGRHIHSSEFDMQRKQ